MHRPPLSATYGFGCDVACSLKLCVGAQAQLTASRLAVSRPRRAEQAA